jgi:hypothetical protein
MIEQLNRAIEEAELQLQIQQRLRHIAESDDWKLLAALISKAINGKINALLGATTTHDEFVAMRAEINTYRSLLEIPKIPDAAFKALADKVKGLLERRKRLHTLGIGSTANRNEVESIKSELTEIQQALRSQP